MKYIFWSLEKNEKLKEKRQVSFEDIALAILGGDHLDIVEHPNQDNLRQFLRAHGLTAEIIHLDVPTPTVAAAAAALGVRPEQIIKSILFLADKQPILIVASGLTRLHRKRLADTLGMSRRRVKIAGPEEVLAITGYEAGAVPPFGHRQRLRTIVETAVLAQAPGPLYGGGGDINALLRLSLAELLAVVGDEVADLAEKGNNQQ